MKKENQFEHTSKATKGEDITRQPFRRSVREELKEIKRRKRNQASTEIPSAYKVKA